MSSWTHRRSALRIAALGVIFLVLGCTTERGQDAPEPPAKQEILPALPGREQPVEQTYTTSATDGERTVSLGAVSGPVHKVTFWYSDDDGSNWNIGKLSEQGQRETPPGAYVSELLAVNAERKLWCAFGYAEGKWLTWTSKDGQTWDHHAPTGFDHEADGFSAVAATADGFIASGYHEESGQEQEPGLWRSADGVAWKREVVRGKGWLTDIAVRGNTAVAVGVHDRDQRSSSGQSASPIALRSTDGGRKWRPISVPVPKDDTGFWQSLASVNATPEGFVATGKYFHGAYAPAVYTSKDGKGWKLDATKSLRRGSSSAGGTALKTGNTVIASIEPDRKSPERDVLVYRDGKKWKGAKLPKVEKDLGLAIQSLDRTPNGVLASVRITDSGVVRGEVWASSDGRAYRRLDLPQPQDRGPIIRSTGFTSSGRGLVVLGTSQGLQTIWEQDSSGAFAAPQVLTKNPTQMGTGIATGEGDFLIWGQFTSPNGNAATWLRLGEKNLLSEGDAFSKVAPYHSSEINHALWAHGRWIVVGESSTNGSVRQSALVSTSKDGLNWKPGQAEKTYSRGDGFGDSDPLTDLAGLETSGRSMSSVTDLPDGFLVVGSANRESESHPARWISNKAGTTWKLGRLPDKGLTEATPTSVDRYGELLVAAGTAKSGGERKHAQVWVSDDSAKSWQAVALDTPGEVTSTQVTKVGERLVVLTTATNNREVWMFSTSDGKSWRKETADLGLSESQRVDFSGWVGGEGEATLLVRIYDNESARHELVTVPVAP